MEKLGNSREWPTFIILGLRSKGPTGPCSHFTAGSTYCETSVSHFAEGLELYQGPVRYKCRSQVLLSGRIGLSESPNFLKQSSKSGFL